MTKFTLRFLAKKQIFCCFVRFEGAIVQNGPMFNIEYDIFARRNLNLLEKMKQHIK